MDAGSNRGRVDRSVVESRDVGGGEARAAAAVLAARGLSLSPERGRRRRGTRTVAIRRPEGPRRPDVFFLASAKCLSLRVSAHVFAELPCRVPDEDASLENTCYWPGALPSHSPPSSPLVPLIAAEWDVAAFMEVRGGRDCRARAENDVAPGLHVGGGDALAGATFTRAGAKGSKAAATHPAAPASTRPRPGASPLSSRPRGNVFLTLSTFATSTSQQRTLHCCRLRLPSSLPLPAASPSHSRRLSLPSTRSRPEYSNHGPCSSRESKAYSPTCVPVCLGSVSNRLATLAVCFPISRPGPLLQRPLHAAHRQLHISSHVDACSACSSRLTPNGIPWLCLFLQPNIHQFGINTVCKPEKTQAAGSPVRHSRTALPSDAPTAQCPNWKSPCPETPGL
ncbi:hypothetical protein M011DRAFT_455613 [Sporormia fimetaria CBS 119925]|uniref:Uncharacterized protein n=1 Tax=Sporormia fimetaria CBS 119925 TaxID=1340428 RepID=A0A6A6VIY3_9PLEO|nr:hypothetical protein M011DRAFT_455613 [Sporormia fimetaria CBS 119925]